MKYPVTILAFIIFLVHNPTPSSAQENHYFLAFNFFGDTIRLDVDEHVQVKLGSGISESCIRAFYTGLNESNFQPIIHSLLAYKDAHQLDDWIFYQLIRKTSEQLSPKADNYERYTLYKWFLLAKCGYNTQLALSEGKLLFYVRSDENIYDIPLYLFEGKQYVCLNYHDYKEIDFEKDKLFKVNVDVPEGRKSFSYKVISMPDFSADKYAEKEVKFTYRDKLSYYKIMLNPEVQNIFANYPGVDFESYFNIPMSKETYNSLIPELKNKTGKMSQKKGIDYLMRFTRQAFLYETDQENFGKEKRLSPEQTLFNKYSDCDDRAALFFYLVKEIYDLPMIVLLYPAHVTIAVEFDKPVGKPVFYKGKKYSVCEPTPQMDDLRVGQIPKPLSKVPFEVVYEYLPKR